MATARQIPIKFCKTLLATGSSAFSPTQASRFFHKLLYEFWGFCVNGGSSLTQPGGIARVNFPSGFQSGSTVLLGTGADGTTRFGSDIFGTLDADFTAIASGSLIGKYLVTWIPGQSSTDDSIYLIKSVEDPKHIRVDVHSGGTRRLGNHPWFWDRNGINWRIVDIVNATNLTGSGAGGSWHQSYMVLNFVSAPTVNPGQAVSQAQVLALTESGGIYQNSEGGVGLIVSPSGSWNGSSFTDSTSLVSGSLSFYGGGSHGNVGNGQVTYDLTAGGDFLIAHVRSVAGGPQANTAAGTGFHIEVPKRLYPTSVDPNPIAWLLWDNQTPSQIASTYYNGFNMVGRDNTVHAMTTLVRSPMGTGVRSDYTGNAYGTGQWQQFGIPAWRFAHVSYDMEDNEYLTTDGVLSLSTPGQFSLSRARLRRVRFTTADLSQGARIGDPITNPGGWVHTVNGVLLPWDNSILPERPWRFGV